MSENPTLVTAEHFEYLPSARVATTSYWSR